MISRLLVLIVSGSFLVSCSPDPRWGPPRSGLREPMEWQYRNSDKPTSISYDEPETRRPDPAVEFVAYRPASFGYRRESGKSRATLEGDGAEWVGLRPASSAGLLVLLYGELIGAGLQDVIGYGVGSTDLLDTPGVFGCFS